MPAVEAVEGEKRDSGGEESPRGSTRSSSQAATRPATRADVLATLAIVGAALTIAVSDPLLRLVSPHPSQEQCAALLDRYVEHVAWAIDPSPASSVLQKRRSLVRAASASHASFARCESDLTQSEVDCAMKASGADAFERCLPQR